MSDTPADWYLANRHRFRPGFEIVDEDGRTRLVTNLEMYRYVVGRWCAEVGEQA